jgi:holliday junction DNA helicase RuvA
MYEYIQGELIEITPTFAIVQAAGIGYFINISLNTYTQLSNCKDCKLYLHHVVREDAQLLFGFFDKKEREIFRQLVSVSGIGANTARVILSSLSAGEIQQAILNGNVNLLTNIKGIGTKTAQRLIVELKDKIGKGGVFDDKFLLQDNTLRDESLSALVMLGFSKASVEKTLDKILAGEAQTTVENLIKKALKIL